VSQDELNRNKLTGLVAPKPYQILCLSGGGYRGLYTAAILERLEAQAGKPLSEVFDLIAGTSIGGILALGLAAGVSARDLSAAFEENADNIFPKRRIIFGKKLLPRFAYGLFKARYPQTGLKQTLETILGSQAQAKVQSLATKVLVSSVELNSGAPRIFRSSDTNCDTPLVDIGLATSAAPTFFPEHLIGDAIMVDGGLIANAPDMLAVFEALQSEHLADLRLISIGTAGREGAKAYRKQRSPGVILGGKSTFFLTLDAQEKLSVQAVQDLLRDRYVRLDADPSQEERQSIGLDVTDEVASKTLRLMADRTWAVGFERNEATFRDILNRTR
jgi:predicted acylesterase/phospholipase RssA